MIEKFRIVAREVLLGVLAEEPVIFCTSLSLINLIKKAQRDAKLAQLFLLCTAQIVPESGIKTLSLRSRDSSFQAANLLLRKGNSLENFLKSQKEHWTFRAGKRMLGKLSEEGEERDFDEEVSVFPSKF